MLVDIWLVSFPEEPRMSAHAEEHFAGSNKLFVSIWVWLVGLTLVEIFLACRVFYALEIRATEFNTDHCADACCLHHPSICVLP